MRKARKMVVGLLMVFGAVSVSFGEDPYFYKKIADEQAQNVKKMVEELEFYEKKTGLTLSGERALEEGRLYLEFVEKVKQSPEKECLYAVRNVMGDDNNSDRYEHYSWSDTRGNGRACLDLSTLGDNYKEFKKDMEYNKELYDAFIRQKANVMGSGNGAGLKDGVNEVGTLSDGTKIEIVKEKK